MRSGSSRSTVQASAASASCSAAALRDAASGSSQSMSPSRLRSRARSKRSSRFAGIVHGVEVRSRDDRGEFRAAPAKQRAHDASLNARIAASPDTPEPRLSRISMVSSWSSAWCAVAIQCAPIARNARRAGVADRARIGLEIPAGDRLGRERRVG
jgi:hypothetical protein